MHPDSLETMISEPVQETSSEVSSVDTCNVDLLWQDLRPTETLLQARLPGATPARLDLLLNDILAELLLNLKRQFSLDYCGWFHEFIGSGLGSRGRWSFDDGPAFTRLRQDIQELPAMIRAGKFDRIIRYHGVRGEIACNINKGRI